MAQKLERLKIIRRVKELLSLLSNKRNIERCFQQRIQIVLLSSEGKTQKEIALELNCSEQTVRNRQRRWRINNSGLEAFEKGSEQAVGTSKLKGKLQELLSDNYRSGTPSRLTEVQKTLIITIACKSPQDYGYVFTTWTHDLLSSYLKTRNIEVSASHVGEILRQNELQPHKSEYWLKPKIDTEEVLVDRLEKLADAYQKGLDSTSGIEVFSSDEKTGIQAIEHKKISARCIGQKERIDPEYTRNGTTTLIASMSILTGKVNAKHLGKTRTEEDYLAHCQEIVAGASPEKEIVIICDNLNTHKSESLVKWVAEKINYTEDLGKKNKKGILKSLKSREEFLENKTHKIRFLYTPKHCSWINQIENWFGKLQRHVITNGQFPSVKNLQNKILNYIDYYNEAMAKPYNWKFNAKKYQYKLTG